MLSSTPMCDALNLQPYSVLCYRRRGNLRIEEMREYLTRGRILAGTLPGEEIGEPGTVSVQLLIDDEGNLLREDHAGTFEPAGHVDDWLARCARHLGITVDHGDEDVVRPDGSEEYLEKPERTTNHRSILLAHAPAIHAAVLCADALDMTCWVGSWEDTTLLIPQHSRSLHLDELTRPAWTERHTPLVLFSRAGSRWEVQWSLTPHGPATGTLIVEPDHLPVMTSKANAEVRTLISELTTTTRVIITDSPPHASHAYREHPVMALGHQAQHLTTLSGELFMHHVLSALALPSHTRNLIHTHMTSERGINLTANQSSHEGLIKLANLPADPDTLKTVASHLHLTHAQATGRPVSLRLRWDGSVAGMWSKVIGYSALLFLCVGLTILAWTRPDAPVFWQIMTLVGVGVYVYLVRDSVRVIREFYRIRQAFTFTL
ncbi:hypothetical protein [Jonesia quinghaiensis]|uniref:hypothetical protein n=1 Tax=Jonesia quinghaiensis TaxID=262806 RepID=UPI000490C3D8|nr:hypothetical protein [Jonesia quinghaiensis]